jgi:tetratricopeptide (TPR) repeat protein
MPLRRDAVSHLVLAGDWHAAWEIVTDSNYTLGWMNQSFAARWSVPLAVWHGDSDLAWRIIGQILPAGPRTEPGTAYFPTVLPLQCLAAELALDAHDFPTASDWLEAHDRWMDWSGAVLGRAEGVLLWGQYHHAMGDPAQARQFAEQALAHATDPRQPLALIAVHRFLGQLETEEQQYEGAEQHLEESLTLAAACAAPFERALTLLEIAGLRIAEGKDTEATDLLAEVRAICEPLEAKPTLAKVAALAQELADREGSNA